MAVGTKNFKHNNISFGITSTHFEARALQNALVPDNGSR